MQNTEFDRASKKYQGKACENENKDVGEFHNGLYISKKKLGQIWSVELHDDIIQSKTIKQKDKRKA